MEGLMEVIGKVLLYLGKFPNTGNDIDGGSILASHLIDVLSQEYLLDVVFIRKNKEIYSDKRINKIRYLEYVNPKGNKFLRRLDNLNTNLEALKDYCNYDLVIICHVSKAFLPKEMPPEFWQKVIIFPMFCTNSYFLAGEKVPAKYTLLEKYCLNKCRYIITPSYIEKEDLQNDYSVSAKKIHVIFRGVNPKIKFKERRIIGRKATLVSIGSVKIQKNNMMQLQILNELVKSGYNVMFNMIVNIQNENMFNEMLDFIKNNNLVDRVNIYQTVNQDFVVSIIDNSDINICTSNWETFGRSIFEGACAGLPTLINDKIEIVKRIINQNEGVFFLKNVSDYVEIIKKLIDDANFYDEANKSLKDLSELVSYKKEKNNLSIFFKRAIKNEQLF